MLTRWLLSSRPQLVLAVVVGTVLGVWMWWRNRT